MAVGLIPIGLGVAALGKGRPGYTNYRRLTVFAPFAIGIGLLAIFVFLVRWKKLPK